MFVEKLYITHAKVKAVQKSKLVNGTYWVMCHFDGEYLLCTEHWDIFPERDKINSVPLFLLCQLHIS